MNRLLTRLSFALILTYPVYSQTSDLSYLVFLRPDPGRKPLTQADAERIQAAHMANIRGMADRGVLAAAGPFGDTPATISGVFVFKTRSLEEARGIAAQDPTVVEHRNIVEAFAWRGPTGIGDEYVRLHKQDPKTPQDMGVQPFCMLYRGAAWEQRQGERAAILRAHDEYLGSLRREGKLGATGPIEDSRDLLAIVIFNRMPDEDARRLMDDDPAVKAGVFRVEYHRWWCAAHVLPGR